MKDFLGGLATFLGYLCTFIIGVGIGFLLCLLAKI